MAAGKAQQILRQRKEAKQKKVLFVLVPIFLLLIAWQGPKTYKALMGGSAPPPAAAPASTEPTSTTPDATTPEPSSAPAPSAEAPLPGTSTTSATGLPDTDPAPAPATGQLVDFSLFVGKDPFVPRDGTPTTNGSGATSGTTTTGTTTTSSGTGSTGTSTAGTTDPTTPTAQIRLNGRGQTARAGTAFPERDPLFRIVSVGSSYVKIGLVSGRFLNGSKTQKLPVGNSLTLVKQPEGTVYKITLVSVSE